METQAQQEAMTRAVVVVADNAARRIAAGRTPEQAKAEAIAEFSELWPVVGAAVAAVLA